MVKRIDNLPDLETLERLGRARDFIDHCYDHPLSLEQISEKACFSRYHFLRLFREAFNKTPHQYLVERRIEEVHRQRRLLAGGQAEGEPSAAAGTGEHVGHVGYLAGRAQLRDREALESVCLRRDGHESRERGRIGHRVDVDAMFGKQGLVGGNLRGCQPEGGQQPCLCRAG